MHASVELAVALPSIITALPDENYLSSPLSGQSGKSVRDARWSNTHQSLGSDHYVLTIQVITSLCKPRQHTARHTDWDAFRERRLHSAASNIEDLSTRTDQLLVDLDAVTASIPTTEDHPAIDSPPCPPVDRSHGTHQPLA
ncbi:hypothetical protein MTO96_051168 [Rhipicephalus appendiculatus]